MMQIGKSAVGLLRRKNTNKHNSFKSTQTIIIIIIIIIIMNTYLLACLITYLITYLFTCLLTYLLTAVDLSLGGSSSYTGTDKTNKNKYT